MEPLRAAFISPGIGDGCGGGAPFFRFAARSLGKFCDETLLLDPVSYPVAAHSGFRHEVVRTSADVIASVEAYEADLVIKASGALAGDEDFKLDLALSAHMQSRGKRLIYLDVDAPSRLPLLAYLPQVYLRELAEADHAVVVVGGGFRAESLYRGMGFVRTLRLQAVAAYEGVCWDPATGLYRDVPSLGRNEHSVASLYVPTDPRFEQSQLLLSDARSAGLSVTEPASTSGGVENDQWLRVLAGSRACLCLLRDDVRGFDDNPSARVFEAIFSGSLVLTEAIDGMSSYLPVEFRSEIPKDVDEWITLRDKLNGRIESSLAAARAFARRSADAQAAEFISFVRKNMISYSPTYS